MASFTSTLVAMLAVVATFSSVANATMYRSCGCPYETIFSYGVCLCPNSGLPKPAGQDCPPPGGPNPCGPGKIYGFNKGCLCVNDGIITEDGLGGKDLVCPDRPVPCPCAAPACPPGEIKILDTCVCLSTALPKGDRPCPAACNPNEIYIHPRGCVCKSDGFLRGIRKACPPFKPACPPPLAQE